MDGVLKKVIIGLLVVFLLALIGVGIYGSTVAWQDSQAKFGTIVTGLQRDFNSYLEIERTASGQLLADFKAASDNQTKNLLYAHEQRVTDLKVNNEKKISSLIVAQEQEIESLKTENEEKLSELEEDYTQQISDIQAAHQQELDTVRWENYYGSNRRYSEVQWFLQRNTTGSYSNLNVVYNDPYFADTVMANARTQQDIRCFIVLVQFTSGQYHVVLAFDTTDDGRVYVEPQNDREVTLTINQSYSQQNSFNIKPNDVIQGITVFD